MTEEEIIKDYKRLKLEYTRLHEDYRRLKYKQLNIVDVNINFSIEDLKDAFKNGINIGYEEGANYGELSKEEENEYFNKWLNNR